jgi:chromosome transmission fidelity protein 18
LAWVKNWDYCVFKKQVKRPFVPWFQQKPGFVNNYKDKMQRPEKRILLLAGPPGLGKTTLAHVIAHHCGYNVVEINASDDRTSDAFKNKVASALQVQAVFGERRPNLIVIDEIDGASAASTGEQSFINMLLKVIQQSAPQKGKAKSNGTLRPIICICNDPNTPILRALKAEAQVFYVKPPEAQTLAKRLTDICTWEGLKVEFHAMLSLCHLAKCDVRSAINNLQFVSQNCKDISHTNLTAHISTKDIQESSLKISELMFKIPTVKEIKAMNTRDPKGAAYISRLESSISNGEHERVMQGRHFLI